MNKLKDLIFTEMHDLMGLCGHCGRRDCEGRKAHSELPDKLDRKNTVLAIERAFAKTEASA